MTPAEKLAKAKPRKRPRRNSAGPRKTPLVCQCREIREGLNLAMRDVALAVKMSVAGVWAIEHGGDVQMTTALKLAKFYGREVSELWAEKKGGSE